MRAVGIVRQSKGREDALSPAEQRERIAEYCRREGWGLVTVHEEIDVSGGTPLEKREGLSAAVQMIEAGRADVILVAYFDRLVRSLTIQAEVVQRVEKAGGSVVAADFGKITEATTAQWVSGTALGMVSEFHRRMTREKTGHAQALAVSRGVVPFPFILPGYRKRDDGVLEPDGNAGVVADAFRLRAGGASILEVRDFLRDHGIDRSYGGTQRMLYSPLYVGEIRFGELVNPAAHEPIVSREIWQTVQKMRGVRGGRPKSDRLLARLGVLRCGTCGARLCVSSANNGAYPTYTHPRTVDCARRVSIGAEIAETFAIDTMKGALRGFAGRASVDADARRAERDLERASSGLDAALRAFEGWEEPAALDRLAELKERRDTAEAQVSHLRGLHAVFRVTVDDLDRATPEELRGLIRETIEWIRVGQGRGASRLTAKLLV